MGLKWKEQAGMARYDRVELLPRRAELGQLNGWLQARDVVVAWPAAVTLGEGKRALWFVMFNFFTIK